MFYIRTGNVLDKDWKCIRNVLDKDWKYIT